MCLGIPMRVRRIDGDYAQVESGRLLRRVNIAMLKAVRVDDYVMVHAGFAIERIDARRAEETLRLVAGEEGGAP